MDIRNKSLFLLPISLIVMLLVFVACANIGTPDGGPYDDTPPKIVRTSPKFASPNSKSQKVVIEFDEIVKLEKASEKVVVSPPQIEQPEINASGRKITVTLIDTLKPNMTYTIDFADAIEDNNEGNPMGDYAFTFSTGESVDTFQVSGYVLEAENLEPIKGIMVGLYSLPDDSASNIPDSIFRTKQLERIARTDSKGHFSVKGLRQGRYRAFALNDQDQSYTFSQRSERIAFSDRIFTPSSAPDMRSDTIWHDSIFYDSIVQTPYTHFYPDDITLRAFVESVQDRYLLKKERPTLEKFTLIFTSGSDTLPKLTGVGFDVTPSTFVVESNENKDTLTYWVRDSLIYNRDTLELLLDYYATDTLGNLALRTDSLLLPSKITLEKAAKIKKDAFDEWAKEYKKKVKNERKLNKRNGEKKEDDEEVAIPEPLALPSDEGGKVAADSAIVPLKEVAEEVVNPKEKKKKKTKKKEDDDIIVPPMPESFLDVKMVGSSGLAPNQNVEFTFSEPIDSVDLECFHFGVKVDSIVMPKEFILRQLPENIMTYRLYAEWEPDSTYALQVDTGAFVSIYGKRYEGQKYNIKIKGLENYSTLFVVLQNADTSAIVQLLDGSDKVVQSAKTEGGKADFYFVTPGTYYMRLFYDRNGNGKWDSGIYDSHTQPEEVMYYQNPMQLKAEWEITQTWNVNELPLFEQKPAKITKQKADKEKNLKNKNKERLEKKKAEKNKK